MKRRIIIVALFALSALVGLCPARAATKQEKVRIGLVDTLSRGVPPAILAVIMRPFQSLMEAQTGLKGEISQGGDALALARKLQEDEVQVGVFHGHEFAWARAKYPKLRAVAVCVGGAGASRVHLVVRADSKARDVGGLRGKVAAVPECNRAYCRLFFERRCVAGGGHPAAFYGKITTPVEPRDALDDLATGDVDVTVVDGQTLQEYRQAKPGRGRLLRTLLESEPFPAGVIAYHDGRFPDATVRRFKTGLVGAKDSPKGQSVLKLLRLTAFEEPPKNHDAALKSIAAAYPPSAP